MPAILQLSILLLVFSGCTGTRRADIHSANPGERILAIRAAVEAHDQQAVPLIVDRLEDEDEAVRFYAILALDKMTGQRLGYDYAKPVEGRAPAVERWRQYVRGGRYAETSGTHAGGGADGSASTEASSPLER